MTVVIIIIIIISLVVDNGEFSWWKTRLKGETTISAKISFPLSVLDGHKNSTSRSWGAIYWGMVDRAYSMM